MLHMQSDFTGISALKNRSLTLESSNRQLYRHANLFSKVTGEFVRATEKQNLIVDLSPKE